MREFDTLHAGHDTGKRATIPHATPCDDHALPARESTGVVPSSLMVDRGEPHEDERAQLRAELSRTQSDLERARHSVRNAAVALTARERELRRTWNKLRAIELAHHELTRSWTWRATQPLRVLGRALRGDWAAVARDLTPMARRAGELLYRYSLAPESFKKSVAHRVFGLTGDFFRGEPLFEEWKRAREKAPRTRIDAPSAADLDARIASLSLPSAARPVVSIIIPTYGRMAYTVACLESIANNPPSVPIEVLVVEDASGEPGVLKLATIRGLRFEANPENLGFLRACNRASALARGEYLHLLNNDTQVTAGWLDALLDTFKAFPECGLAGSKFVFPDGRLLEAGGIVWRDASAWNYGRFDDETRPPYSYVRETDYCSGASLMVRRELFERVGRFDERYAPAYYEDTDLAFAVRAAGLKVYFQPGSVVVHHEGVSHGGADQQGGQPHKVVNRPKFRERWREVLDRDHFANGEHLFLARDRSRNRKCILTIDHYVPQPDRDAGSRSMAHCLQLFCSQGMNVKFWPQNLWFDPSYTPALQQAGIEVLYGPEYVNRFDAWIKENGRYVDFVFLSRPQVAVEFIDALRKHTRAKILYYGHEVHHLSVLHHLRLRPDDRDLQARGVEMRELEQALWGKVDVIYHPSDEETAYVDTYLSARRLPAVARTLPLFSFERFASSPETGLSERRDIMFVAGFGHPPNIDAAEWLVADVMPRVWEQVPGTHLYVVGSNPTERVQALAAANVSVTGHVSDATLEKHYASMRLAVAPLRYGAGLKGKVIEAMSYGVPVVTTSTGAQGLARARPALVATDDPVQYADEIVSLLKDDERWRRTSAALLAFCRDNYSPAAMRQAFQHDIGWPGA